MTDQERAEQVHELLETAEGIMSAMDGEADPLVLTIVEQINDLREELDHIEYDEDGHVVAQPDDPYDDDEEEEDEDDDFYDDDEDEEEDDEEE